MENKHPVQHSHPIRWGITGTAQIARKNWKAILNSGEGIVAGVASRDADRSRRFIAECQQAAPFEVPPEPVAGYEALIASPEIDAVYLPLPTGLRKAWVVRAAEAGKHVLCEKPCGVSATELREMIDACERNGVQFMDGVMFMHSGRLDLVRAVLDDGASVGSARRVTTSFSFCAPEDFLRQNIRANHRLEPLGCLGDLGWYCLRFALWVAKGKLPREVTGRLLAQTEASSRDGAVPIEFSGELVFDPGLSAEFYCSFLAGNQQWAKVSGSKGYLQVTDFVLPFQGPELAFEVRNDVFEQHGCDFEMKPRPRRFAVREYGTSHPSAQESNMFRNFGRQIRSGQLNAEWPQMALRTQQMLDACLESARDGGRMVKLKAA